MRKIIIILLFVVSCFGTDWWVDAVNGNDANSGKDIDNPFATLGLAADSVTVGDTIYCLGTFTELLTLVNGSHEGTYWSEWPDSAYWVISGGGIRRGITISTSCGIFGEKMPKFHNLKITNIDTSGANDCCCYLGGRNAVWFVACSLLNADKYTGADNASHGINLGSHYTTCIIESTYFQCAAFAIKASVGFSNIQASYCSSDSGGWFSDNNAGEIVFNSNNNVINSNFPITVKIGSFSSYTGYQDSYYTYRPSSSCFYFGRGNYLRLEKCLVRGVSSSNGFYLVAVNGPVRVDLINTTFDGLNWAVGATSGAKQMVVNALNVIINNCVIGIYNATFVNGSGLIISNCVTDTSSIYNVGAFTYATTNPQLDANKVQQAGITGSKTFLGLDAPLVDDLGYYFMVDNAEPYIGWRSPDTISTDYCSGGGGTTTIDWGMRSPARRLKGHE